MHFKYKDAYRLKENGWRKIFANTNQKKVGVATLISDTVYYRASKGIKDTLVRDREG